MSSGPGFWARRGVLTATWLLPAGPTRERYRREFLGELHGLDRRRRAAFTLGVLSRALALRVAVAGNQPRGEEVTMKRTPVLCLIRWHTYRTRRTEDGQAYKRCIRCGKDHDGTPSGWDNYGAGLLGSS
jgi:hypothetical protein